VRTLTEKEERTQPEELSTHERMGTYLRAAADGVAHEAKDELQTGIGERQQVGRAEVESIVEDWPQPQKKVAQQMIERYGAPNEATPTKLFWYRNDPWKRTEITADAVAHNFPAPHTDFLTQVIDYRVPPEKIADIVRFDGSIFIDRTKGEVAARCDAEAANVLGMNMVHEIVTGKRTVEEAREITAQTTVAYSMGRSAPYAERLLFDVPQGGTHDLDKGMISQAVLQQTAGKVKDVLTGGEEEATERRTGTGAPTSP
jgi:hypothetical protein